MVKRNVRRVPVDAPTPRRKAKAKAGAVPSYARVGFTDFSKRFKGPVSVQAMRVQDGVSLDVRVATRRPVVQVCYAGLVGEMIDWLEEHRAELERVVREVSDA